jgi:hypothetical protein
VIDEETTRMPIHHLTDLGGARRTIATCLLAVTATGAAAQSSFEEDFDNREKAWKEIEVQLPAPPRDENLIGFDVGPTARLSYAIDAKSLSIGSDEVVRYTLVAKSPGGATTVSYEGIRCKSKERKLYAFGHADGSWGRSRRDGWEPLTSDKVSPQQNALASDYFCRDSSIAGNVATILDRMRRKARLWAGNRND